MRERKKHVWHEAGFFLYGEDARLDVIGQVVDFRYRVTADGFVGHSVILS